MADIQTGLTDAELLASVIKSHDTTATATELDAAVVHSGASHAPTNADNTATNETSHADVLVDADIGVSVLSPTGDGSGLTAMTKSQVGLSNVDNTSDADKVLTRYNTGIKKGGNATLNVDISKIDIEETEYTIQGVDYFYAGITGYSPNLQVGETARRIGFDASGLVDQAGKFTDAQKQTILPICRMQVPQGQSGPGADLLAPLHTHYYIGEDGWRKRLFHEKALGVLYSSGGVISENATPLRLDETTGLLYNGQGHDVIINGGTVLTGVVVYHVATSWSFQTDAIIVANTTQYDNGTDLVTLSNNKWAMHTLLRSPKEDGEFFVIISQAEYASQADAEAVPPDYGPFLSQQFSDMIAVAQIIIQQGDTSITQIKDARPFIGGNVGATLGTANLQQTLDNSIDPEMAMQTTLTFKEGTNVATVDVIEVTNFSDTQVFAVTGEGNVSLSGVVDGRDLATDGTKLDGVEANANNYSHPTGDGNLHVPANSTTNDGKVLTAGATAGLYTWEVAAGGDLVDDTTPQLGGDLDTNGHQVQYTKGADVVSATALPVLTDGNYFDVTGTTSITSINTTKVGTIIKLHFDGILILTHHATDLILPSGANITTAAGDEFEFLEYATGDYRCTSYVLASGEAIVGGGGGGIGEFIDTSIAISSDDTALAVDDGTDNENIGIGTNAGKKITSGSKNTVVGWYAGANITTATNGVYVGSGAGGLSASNCTGSSNTAVGDAALGNITSGFRNSCFGTYSGANITSGDYNVCVGSDAGNALTTANDNTLVGNSVGNSLTGSRNVFIGNKSGWGLTSVNDKLAIGNNTTEDLIEGDFVAKTLNFNGSLAVREFLTLTPTATAPTVNNSFFVDSADNILKFKDNSGTIKTVTLA